MISLRSCALVAIAVISTACASGLDVKRPQSPLYEVQSNKLGLSLVSVNTSNIDNSSGMDPATIDSAVKSAVQEYISGKKPEYAFKDGTGSGAKADFNVELKDGALMPSPTATISAVPDTIDTPLVTAIYVMQVKFDKTTDGNNRVRVTLAFSTATKDGQPVKTEIVSSEAEGKTPGHPHLDASPDRSLISAYRATQGVIEGAFQKADFLPEETDKLFKLVLDDAVGFHYFPLFSHDVSERYALVEDGALKDGATAAKSGNWDAALVSWQKAADSDVKANYDIAVAYLVKGDDVKAMEALTKASGVPQAEELATKLKERLALKKTIQPKQ